MTFGMDRLSVLVVARTTQLLAATLGSWGVELRYLRAVVYRSRCLSQSTRPRNTLGSGASVPQFISPAKENSGVASHN